MSESTPRSEQLKKTLHAGNCNAAYVLASHESLEQESNMLLEALKKAEFNLRKAAARHIADGKMFDLYLGEAEQALAAIALAEKARES